MRKMNFIWEAREGGVLYLDWSRGCCSICSLPGVQFCHLTSCGANFRKISTPPHATLLGKVISLNKIKTQPICIVYQFGKYEKYRSLTPSLWPFGPAIGHSGFLDLVLRALRALRLCDLSNVALDSGKPNHLFCLIVFCLYIF